MAKKISFDSLPEMVAEILENVSRGASGDNAEMLARLTRIERKIEQIEARISPEKPTMDMQTVCRVLKLSPKSVNDLEDAGVLVSRKDGRSRLFDEASVIKYFRGGKAWQEAIAEPEPASAPATEGSKRRSRPTKASPAEPHERIDINAASELLGRLPSTIYQMVGKKKLPFYKDGHKVYFFADELRKWTKKHPARKGRGK